MGRAWRWLERLAAGVGVLVLTVMLTPVTRWWANALAGPWYDPPGDVLIVLTGSSAGEVIGLDSYWRAVYAVRYFQTGNFPRIVVSGASAAAIREFMLAQGVPAQAVRAEAASGSTRESALNVAALLAAEPDRYGGRRLVLLTSEYHMTRAIRAFRKAGVPIEPQPVPDLMKRYSSPLQRWGVFLELALETVKLGYYRFRGWV
jgi:uncharacterized SAM-binding protein YcdF (DUF218 family)